MESLLGNRTRRADITFHSNGKIDITSRLTKMLGLCDGDVIDIAFDRGEYYIYRMREAKDLVGRHEAQCHGTHRGRLHPTRSLRAYSKRICTAILKASNATDKARIWAGELCEIDKLGKAVVIIPASNNFFK